KLSGRDATVQLGLRVVGENRIVVAGGRAALQAHPLAALEVDEEQADLLRGEEISRRQIHAVAVVDRKRDRALVENADETGLASFVRALRLAVLVDGGDEEHVTRFDARAIA